MKTHRGVELVPGTSDQIEKLLNRMSKDGWVFMAFGERRNEKGRVLPGVVVWFRLPRLVGHG